MAGFDSDFSSGEEASARLAKRMEEKLKSAEAAARQAEEDKRFSRRLREQARRETDAEAKAPRGSTSESDEAAIERRLAKERELAKTAGQELQVRQRISGELQSQEQSTRRLLNAGSSSEARGASRLAEEQLLLASGSSGGGGRRPPPRHFPQPPPEEPQPPRRPQLPSGREPIAISQYSEPHPERAGQVIAERELRTAEEATRTRLNANSASAQGATVTDRLSGSIGRETAIQASANREFQRFGALSSEWIGAAGRGSTTIGELGRQTTATIGKFGGWLAAGSLVFGALDAVRAIGKGAIESGSGVQQMSRVIDNLDFNKAQKAVRELSEEFNLPIGEVTEVGFDVGKAYHDESDALEATKAALYALKIGEIDAGTAGKYLISIINGFQLPASKTGELFDELVTAQKRYAIDLPSLMQGVGKAGGSFRSAGGHLETLISLITVLQHVSGQSGNTIGTAILRSPHFIETPKNEGILKQFGIDPKISAKHSIEDIYNEALVAADGKSGEVQRKIAEGLFGPQYGSRVGTFLLQNKKLLEEAEKQISPKHSKGAAQEQLQIVLGKSSERIGKIGVQLEDIGSSLAELGAFNIFGAGLEGATALLHEANQLLEIFNQLPGPAKEMVVYFLQARAILGTLRKFNVGDNFQEGTLGRRVFSGPNRTARLYNEQLTGTQGELRDRFARTNSAAVGAAIGTETSQAKYLAAKAEREALEREGHSLGGAAPSGRLLAAQDAELAAQGSYSRALGRFADLDAERTVILTQLKNTSETQAALARETTDANAQQLAARNQEVIQGSFQKGAQSEDQYGRQLGVQFVKDPVTGLYNPQAISEAEQEAAIAAARAGQVGAEGGKIAAVKSRLTSGFGRAKLALSSADEAMIAARTGIQGAEKAASGLYSSLGGLTGIGTAALFALPLLQGPIEELAQGIAGGTGDIEQAEHLFDPKNSKRYHQLQAFYKGYSDAELKKLAVEQGLGNAGVPEGAPDWYNAGRALQDRQLQEAYNKRAKQQGFREQLFPDQLASRLQQFTQLDPNSSGYGKAKRKLEKEIETGASQFEPKEYDQVKKHFEEVVAKNVNKQSKFFTFLNDFNKQSDKLLESYQKNLSSLVSAGPAYASQHDVRALVHVTEVSGLRELTSGKSGLEAKGAKQLQELTGSLATYGQEEFKIAQTLAKTDRQRQAAYGPYLQKLNEGLDYLTHTRSVALGQVNQELKRIEGKARRLKASNEGGGFDLDAFGAHVSLGGPNPKDEARYNALTKAAKELRGSRKAISKALSAQIRQQKALILEQREAQTEEHISVINEVGEVASAKIGGEHPVAQAQATLGAAEKALSYARGRNAPEKTVRTAYLAVLQGRETLEQAIKSEAEELSSSVEALAEAKANGDPVLTAKAELAKAVSDLHNAKKPAERIQAEAELLNAEHKLDEARADIALSRLGLAAARTEDPVKKAALKVREAEQKLSTSHGAAARNEARAAKVEAKREQREAVATQAIENVEFDADIGKITTDQEIAAYTRLLHTLKLGKQAKRNLIEKIHSLQEEASGSLELTVGNIALPTLYDIRRAVQGGVNGGVVGPGSYSDNSTTHLEFHVHGDQAESERAIDNTLKRHTKNSKRSAGVG